MNIQQAFQDTNVAHFEGFSFGEIVESLSDSFKDGCDTYGVTEDTYEQFINGLATFVHAEVTKDNTVELAFKTIWFLQDDYLPTHIKDHAECIEGITDAEIEQAHSLIYNALNAAGNYIAR